MVDKPTEQHVIGILIMFPKSIYRILKYLKPQVFEDHVCRKALEAILSLLDEGTLWDGVLVGIRLQKLTGELGYPDIMDCMTSVSSNTGLEEKYFHLLELYISREHVRIANKGIALASDPTKDPIETQEIIKKELEALDGLITKDANSTIDDVLARTYADMTDRQEGKVVPYYKTGHQKLDDILQMSEKNILLIGGKSGSSKTKSIINMMYKLFSGNDKISCLWYSMEDPADKILRAFMAIETKLTDSILQSKQRTLTMSEMDSIIALRDKFVSWDIEYVEKASSVKSIRANFKAFCNQRPDNLNILIIDNLMILEENGQKKNQTEIDDEIARGIQKIMNETNGYIIAVHHFTDEQLNKMNFSSGYRPRESHLKGSTRYRDVATQIMLINRPSQYGDIVEHYRGREYVNHLLICEITKNRNNATGIVRFLSSPETNSMYEL